MADATIKNIPRNPALGVIADWLMSAKKTGGTIGDFFLGKSPEVLDSLSYGFKPTTGQGMTFGVKPEAVDLMNLTPIGSVAGMAGKPVAKMAGREIARQVETGTGILGRNVIDPRMNMIAYHGSPHSFDKFDMSKIGTGEGAQAYGHGLYFADNPSVAKEYQLALGNKPAAVDDFAGFEAQAAMAKNKGNVKNSIAWLENRRKTIDEAKQFLIPGAHEKQIADIDEAIRRISSGEVNKNKGTLYKVDIADEAIPNMLLWDKPLSEQTPEVQKALKNSGINFPEQNWNTGAKIYEAFGGKGSFSNNLERRQHQTDALKNLGIQGIRYLDAGSRGQGAGTMNTVVFDDKLVKILEKNGKPIK